MDRTITCHFQPEPILLIARISIFLMCSLTQTHSFYIFFFQEKLMGHLGVVLYEYLGEEYPEVLGSILGALKVRLRALYEV